MSEAIAERNRAPRVKPGMETDKSETTGSVAACPFPVRMRARTFVICFILMILALVLIPFAARTHGVFHHLLHGLPLEHACDLAVQCAGVAAVCLVAALVWVLDPRRRPALAYVLVATVLATNANQVIKEICGRARPAWSLQMNQKGKAELESYVASHPGTPVQVVTADQWLFFKKGRPYASSIFESFPSGHACSAFALAAVLVLLYPRARIVWLVVATLCALERVRSGRHFTEDILFGAAEGWLLAMWACSWNWPRRVAAALARNRTRS